jgi:hypothetical protein
MEKEIDGKWTQVAYHLHWLFGIYIEDQHSYRIRVTAVSPKHVYRSLVSDMITINGKERVFIVISILELVMSSEN